MATVVVLALLLLLASAAAAAAAAVATQTATTPTTPSPTPAPTSTPTAWVSRWRSALTAAAESPRLRLAASIPSWAYAHWVWLPSRRESQAADEAFVANFTARGIRVGALNVDSRWATGVNTFVPDAAKFPDMKGMIARLHAKGVRVIAWATGMVDETSPNYKEGYDKGYYLDFGAVAKWWHGWGSFVDLWNPAALEWWHGQMDTVLDIGLDGFKCDGTDPILFELGGVAWSHDGFKTESEYASAYYGDFFNYSRHKNPDALIMSRPVDSIKDIYLSFSPHFMMWSGWVGDQDGDFSGMQDALRNMFHSAWRGYLNFGSDTAGYRITPARTKTLFLRWSQMSAFCTLFENGGERRHGPWEYDEETVTIYKKFVDAHYEIGPYLESTGVERFAAGKSQMWPLAEDTIFTPSTWDYLLGPDILMCPMVSDAMTRTIDFPAGNDWIGFFNASDIHAGGSKVTIPVPISESPVFKKKGSLMALHAINDVAGHGAEGSTDDVLTLAIAGVSPSYASEVAHGLLAPKMAASRPPTAATMTATIPVHGYKQGRVQYASYTHVPTARQTYLTVTAHNGRDIQFLLQLVRTAPTSATLLLNSNNNGDGATIPNLGSFPTAAACHLALRANRVGFCSAPEPSGGPNLIVAVRPGKATRATATTVALDGVVFA